MRVYHLIFPFIIKEWSGCFNFIHTARKQLFISHHRTADFKTFNRRFQNHLATAIMIKRILHAFFKVIKGSNFMNTETTAGIGRVNKDR